MFKAFWSRSGIGSKMHTFLIHFSGRCNVLVAKAQEWEAGNPGPASTSSPDFLFDLRRVASSPFIFIPRCPGNDSIPHEWQPMRTHTDRCSAVLGGSAAGAGLGHTGAAFWGQFGLWEVELDSGLGLVPSECLRSCLCSDRDEVGMGHSGASL